MKILQIAQPRGRFSTLSIAGVGRIGAMLALLLAAGSVQSQPDQPTVNFQTSASGSNAQFQLATDPGWFYTLQQSTTLTNWGYAADLFASDISLNFTNAI